MAFACYYFSGELLGSDFSVHHLPTPVTHLPRCIESKCTHSLLKVSPPEDSDTKLIIDKMASFVAEGGPELEKRAQEDYKENPVFS